MNKAYPCPIILGSRSPRRQALLQQVGVDFDLLDFEIDESVLAGEAPLSYVERMACEKAKFGWQMIVNQQPDWLDRALLTADTGVVLDDKILGKPESPQHAMSMLAELSNTEQQVMTSVALISRHGLSFMNSITIVKFATLSTKQMNDYRDSGEGLDKAGGYAIQGAAARFVESINGSYSGVVGLPLYETCLLLDKYFEDNS